MHQWGYVGTVRDSAEFRRIAALPRRTEPPRGYERLSDLFRRTDGGQVLRPVQAQALAELALVGGLLAIIRVGGGKTLITYLAAEMLDVHRPLLLVPAKLVRKTQRDFDELSRHWMTTRRIAIQSYEKLGRMNYADYLKELSPDLLICDEVHKIKHMRAAVTRRVGRYMTEHPETRFIGLSGTITQRSLQDYAHLAEWALGQGSPVPLKWEDLCEWCGAVDEQPETGRYLPGVLASFGDGSTALDQVRDGLRRRVVETPGVVATSASPIDASLVIMEWLPGRRHREEVLEAYEALYGQWQTPDGVGLLSAADIWRVARTLAVGFYYKWNPEPPAWWLEPRKKWAAFVRASLSRSRTLDSPAQVAELHKDSKLFLAWEEVRTRYVPSVEAVWIDRSIVEKAAAWAREDEGIIWVDLQAAGRELEACGVLYYGEMGVDSRGRIIEEASGGIAASIEANKEGRNLQRFSRNLVLTPPTTGSAWEQMLGRTHRDGQQADEVSVEVYFGCKESCNGFYQARADAEYQQKTTGSPQKLLEATITFAEHADKWLGNKTEVMR